MGMVKIMGLPLLGTATAGFSNFWTIKLSFLFSFSSDRMDVNIFVISNITGVLFVAIDLFPFNSIALSKLIFVFDPTVYLYY